MGGKTALNLGLIIRNMTFATPLTTKPRDYALTSTTALT